MKTAVVTDTGSGLRAAEIEAPELFLLPLQILIDEKAYLDGVEIDTQDVVKALKEDKFPKTSMPVVQQIEDLFREIQAQGYDEIIAVPLTAGLSSTFSIMRTVSEMLNLKMVGIDVYTTCMLQRYVAESCVRMIREGKSAQEIADEIQPKINAANSILLPNDMQHLKRGGRLTPMAASLATLLKIRPILMLNQETGGKIDVFAKVRTESRAAKEALEITKQNAVAGKHRLFVLHSDSLERALELKRGLLEAGYPEEMIEIGEISSVIAVHTGLNSSAIQYIEAL